jgi:fructokinase
MFIVCGEALMDVFATADTPTGTLMDARIGGSPLNVASGLARLRQPVAFFGGLSTGFLGDRLRRALAEEGVRLDCVARVDAPTTLGLVGLDAQGVPSYAFYGVGCADRLMPMSALDAIPTEVQALHLGSYAMVVEPVAATQRALVEQLRGRVLVAYDPNVRLNVEPDLARWRDTLSWMLPRTHLLKISDEDLDRLFPGAAPGVLAAQWLAAGVELVVLTRGAAGATAWTRRSQVHVPGRTVAVVDTVGAGDTFQAALLTGLAETGCLVPGALREMADDRLAALLDFAVGAAAITCSRRGADLPRRAELPPLPSAR